VQQRRPARRVGAQQGAPERRRPVGGRRCDERADAKPREGDGDESVRVNLAGQRHQLEQYRVHGDQRDGGAPAVGARVCATQVVKPASSTHLRGHREERAAVV